MEQIFLRIGFLLFAITVANLGTTAYAAHQIGMNMMSLTFSSVMGLLVASVALIGRSLGEERRRPCKATSPPYVSESDFSARFCDVDDFSFFGRDLYGLFSGQAGKFSIWV